MPSYTKAQAQDALARLSAAFSAFTNGAAALSFFADLVASMPDDQTPIVTPDPPALHPPVNTGLPTITGTAQEAADLTANVGTWSNTPTTYAVQWYRGTTPIPSANGLTYRVVAADIDSQLKVRVVAGNDDGLGDFADSDPTATIVATAPTPPDNTVKPSITGTAQTGNTLTASRGTWTGVVTNYQDEWCRDNVLVSGATSLTYALGAGDVGHSLTFRTTAFNSGTENGVTETSAPTATIVTPPPPPTPGTVDLPVIPSFTLPAGAVSVVQKQITTSGRVYQDIHAENASLVMKVPAPSGVTYDIDGLLVQRCKTDSVAGLIRVYGGALRNATFEDIVMENVTYSPGVSACVFISSNSTLQNLIFRRISAHFTQPITSTGDVYGGITFFGKDANDVGDNILIEDVSLICDEPGVLYSDPTAYKNRDGIVPESGYKNITINRYYAKGFPDGGIDTKCPSMFIDNYTAENCAKTLRMWMPGHHGKIASLTPHTYHMMHMGDGLREFDFVRFVGSAPLVRFETDKNTPNPVLITVKINSWDVSTLNLGTQKFVSRPSALANKWKLITPMGTYDETHLPPNGLA